MESPLRSPSRRRSVPHIVAPTFRDSRDAMLSTSRIDGSELLPQHEDDDGHARLGSSLYGAIDERSDGESDEEPKSGNSEYKPQHISFRGSDGPRRPLLHRRWECIERAASQIPAVALITLFHLMVGIPFGVSYFPVAWKSSSSAAESAADNEAVSDSGFVMDGPFPLPGKEALGIRMFLFSTIVGQLVLTFASNFDDSIALQMVENVPFCQALSYIVVEMQGYGKESLSTLFFLFGLASVLVGLVFYVLGRAKLGRILYFFPAHVLVGCIGGIGIFIARTGLEVTANATLPLSAKGCKTFVEKFHLLVVVFAFDAGLRTISYLTKDATSGKSRYPLLSPIYFILISPVFYVGALCFGALGNQLDEEYFFPSLDDCSNGEEGGDCSAESGLWYIFQQVDFATISWPAVARAIPTMIALVLFSLIHVPINIPAFAVSTQADVDMNVELEAHGWSNGIVGLFGGLQNYQAYTQSMIYTKSGGRGKSSSLAVAAGTTLLYFIGPGIASYLPRCMAGTLLLHCGLDLFSEGVYDSWGTYDYLEYSGIWAIVIVMTIFGMEAALMAGAISALLTYAIQSVAYPKPIRGSMTAATLRSSEWNRSPPAFEILDSEATGRIRIRVVQFQGHLFFGNISLLNDGVKTIIKHNPLKERPFILIIDFTLVLGIDSSAAQAIVKLRDSLADQFGVKLCIFVPGSSEGFPCELNLYELLNSRRIDRGGDKAMDNCDHAVDQGLLARSSRVCDELDQALIYAEDFLIAMADPTLLYDNIRQSFLGSEDGQTLMGSLEEERTYAIELLSRKCPGEERTVVEQFFSYFRRELYNSGDVLWRQGTTSDSAKLLVSGELMSSLENEAGTTEPISIGSMIGESGLVDNNNRNSTVRVLADDTVLYSLSRESWEKMKEEHPNCAHLLYHIVVSYLTMRIQHVSNRIFETRCLPI